MSSTGDRIWRRALLRTRTASYRAGDCALASLLFVDTLVLQGGVHGALGNLERDEILEAADGYSFFGFDAVAAFLRGAAEDPMLSQPTHDTAVRANRRYAELVPDRSYLSARFEEVFSEREEQFAPLDATPPLSAQERALLLRCLEEAVDDRYFEDWEFPALMGFSRAELRRFVDSHPALDDFATGGESSRIAGSVLLNLTLGPHDRQTHLESQVGATLSELRLLHDRITEITQEPAVAPDDTAVRVALWRALHVQVDASPHVLEDEVGLKLAAPDDSWRDRPDMSPFTRPFRASIVARARFIEDLVAERAAHGLEQYVILGAGLDTFAQRRPELASRLLVFEIDRPGPQEWKRRRLLELGFGIPPFLRLVPVDFEAGELWWAWLAARGFDSARPSLVASTGVSMYLTRTAITATLRQVAALAPGSTLAMSFMLPIEWADPDVRPGIERAAAGARANGTPFISFFTPEEMLALAREAGFREVRHVSAAALAERYFAGRTDGLRPPNHAEELLVATT